MPGIPQVDFGSFLSGDAAARRRVAGEIRAACSEFGFLNVANLPLPDGLLERVSAKAREFFALPGELKEAIGRSELDVISGYVGVAVEHLDTQQPGDLKESFSLNQASLGLLDRWHIPVAGFRETVLDLHDAGARACASLLQAMALSLDAPEDFFVDKHAPHAGTVRFFHYPPVEHQPGAGQLRAGSHTDYGTVTLVFQDGVEGLEALCGRSMADGAGGPRHRHGQRGGPAVTLDQRHLPVAEAPRGIARRGRDAVPVFDGLLLQSQQPGHGPLHGFLLQRRPSPAVSADRGRRISPAASRLPVLGTCTAGTRHPM